MTTFLWTRLANVEHRQINNNSHSNILPPLTFKAKEEDKLRPDKARGGNDLYKTLVVS